MATKPYLISIASKTKGYERYRKTREVVLPGVHSIDVTFYEYPGHLHRLDYLPDRFDPNDWVIFTDTDDVIFQLPIPDLSSIDADIIVANEGVRFKANGFWRGVMKSLPKPIVETVADLPIYNAGTWAMKAKRAYELQQFIADLRSEVDHPNADQILYNLYIDIHRKHTTEHPYIFTTLYANIEKGNVVMRDKTFVNKEGIPYCIVHANGDSKKYLP